jgi:hypothetical protein
MDTCIVQGRSLYLTFPSLPSNVCFSCRSIISYTPLAIPSHSTASYHSNAPSASYGYNAPFVNSAPSRMELRDSFPSGNQGYFTSAQSVSVTRVEDSLHELTLVFLQPDTPSSSSQGIPLSPSTASEDSFRPRSAPALAFPPQIMLEEAPAAPPAPPQSTRPPRTRVASEAIQESARLRRRNLDAATYPCPRPGCTATFTRRHNLKSETRLAHVWEQSLTLAMAQATRSRMPARRTTCASSAGRGSCAPTTGPGI